MITRDFIEDRLEEILPTVTKPGRYTGGELVFNHTDELGSDIRLVKKAVTRQWKVFFPYGSCSTLEELVSADRDRLTRAAGLAKSHDDCRVRGIARVLPREFE